jgi:hypothetical protein
MKKQIQKAQFGKIIKREREVEKTPEGKSVYKSTYNKLTGRTKVVEKDIEYKNKNNSTPRTVYKNTTIVKRDNDKNWKSEKDTKTLKQNGKLVKKNVEYTTYKKGGSVTKGYHKMPDGTIMKDSAHKMKTEKVKVNAGGEKHVVYKKTTKIGEGKVGHIMVNHPTKDKGQWDTIDLTAKGKAKTIKQGVAATKKWHKDNPNYKYKGNGKK